MTNAPVTRKTHVIRILGTNANGDVLQDIWLDIERIDIAKSATNTGEVAGQGYQRLLKWNDDPANGDGTGNLARKTFIIKVCSPDEDPTDPTEWVEVTVIQYMKSVHSGQGQQDKHLMDPDNDLTSARVVEVRQISHWDTSIDDAAQAAFDADPTLKVYVVQGSDYTLTDGTKDTSQYVNHEVISYLKHYNNNNENVDKFGVQQGQQVKLLNQYIIDQSDVASATSADVPGPNGFNPPWRLDPYQTIINVQFRKVFAYDMYVFGAGGSDGNHIRIGARISDTGEETVLLIDSGSFFGAFGERVQSIDISVSGTATIAATNKPDLTGTPPSSVEFIDILNGHKPDDYGTNPFPNTDDLIIDQILSDPAHNAFAGTVTTTLKDKEGRTLWSKIQTTINIPLVPDPPGFSVGGQLSGNFSSGEGLLGVFNGKKETYYAFVETSALQGSGQYEITDIATGTVTFLSQPNEQTYIINVYNRDGSLLFSESWGTRSYGDTVPDAGSPGGFRGVPVEERFPRSTLIVMAPE